MTIGFLGGDRRMEIAADFLRKAGQAVRVNTGSAPREDFFTSLDALVLPYPATRDGVHITATAIPFASLPLSRGTHLFGGRLPAAWREGRVSFDAEEDEAFLQRNAYLTAAAGVSTALRATERAFFGVSAAVVGYGRIGKEAAKMLRALGADTAVYVRRQAAREEAARDGFRAYLLEETERLPAGVVLATVPAPAPNLTHLSVKGDALVYDLGGGLPATLPGENGESVLTVPLRAAPGVFAPLAAGELYGRFVLDAIARLERNDTR